MFTKSFSILGTCLAALALSPTAPARAADGLTLSGGAFHPRCSGIEYDSNGLRLSTLKNSTIANCKGAVYLAPVVLPQGSAITTLAADIFQKNNGINAYPIKVSLVRYDALPLKYSVLAEVTFPAITEQGLYSMVAGVSPAVVVDNTNHAYFVSVDMQKREGVQRDFYRARIYYNLED